MASPRDGTVLLSMPDGRAVPLRFTWRAIDKLGAGGVIALIDKATSGEPGDLAALAMLIEAASDGALSVDELMTGEAPAFDAAALAVGQAYRLALRRPQGEAGSAGENPLLRLLTLLRQLGGRLAQRA